MRITLGCLRQEACQPLEQRSLAFSSWQWRPLSVFPFHFSPLRRRPWEGKKDKEEIPLVPPPLPTPPCGVGQGGGVDQIHRIGQCPRVQSDIEREKRSCLALWLTLSIWKEMFSLLFFWFFFFRRGPSGTDSFYYFYFSGEALLHSFCVYNGGFLGPWPSPLPSPFLPQLSSNRFTVFIKHQLTSLLFFPLSPSPSFWSLLPFIFLKPEPCQQDTWREVGSEAEKNK